MILWCRLTEETLIAVECLAYSSMTTQTLRMQQVRQKSRFVKEADLDQLETRKFASSQDKQLASQTKSHTVLLQRMLTGRDTSLRTP